MFEETTYSTEFKMTNRIFSKLFLTFSINNNKQNIFKAFFDTFLMLFKRFLPVKFGRNYLFTWPPNTFDKPKWRLV